MNDDAALLEAWIVKRSETAFASLVSKYANLVYGTALRVLSGNPHAAEDVAQAVFVRLAQKACRINPPMLAAWLYRQAWAAAQNTLRQSQRRVRREKEAVIMASLETDPNELWNEFAPHLDQAISKLSAKNQAALVLRFFQQKDFREVGQALGTNEDTAQKRVSRALEKLRILLAEQGITVSVSALPALLAVSASSAAPASVIASATHAAVAAGAAGTTLALFLHPVMMVTKFKSIALGAALAAGFLTPLWLQHREIAALRQNNADFQTRLEAAREQNLTNPVVPPAGAPDPTPANEEQFRELLRLRGEAAVLRRRVADLEKGLAEKSVSAGTNRDFIPAENFVFAGYADPESSLQTYMWALKHGDTNAFLRAVSPELAKTYSEAMNGPEPEYIRRSMAAEIDSLKGIRILDAHVKSPSMVVLTIQESGAKERRSLMTMLKIDGEWKLLDKSSR